MKLAAIQSEVNKLLAGERHSYQQLRSYLDKTIDDINQHLHSSYPVFSELPAGADSYDYFPDRYIRSVVCIGAAWYYFTVDEEGIDTANQFRMLYIDNMFAMVRDHINYVPEEYQDTTIKALPSVRAIREGERGVEINASSIHPT